ncbi:uncharacterized protein [Ptychodera flava]|uniref:uncharacterized protein n=1 Tax=Ptychodera flava TaxID=63121 RepID=UPI003969FF54
MLNQILTGSSCGSSIRKMDLKLVVLMIIVVAILPHAMADKKRQSSLSPQAKAAAQQILRTDINPSWRYGKRSRVSHGTYGASASRQSRPFQQVTSKLISMLRRHAGMFAERHAHPDVIKGSRYFYNYKFDS